MLRMLFAAGAVLFSTAAAANVPVLISDDGHIARVNYQDLDLGTGADRTRLTSRIRMAAGMLCLDPYGADSLSPARAKCYQSAVASGVAQMNAIPRR